MLSTKARISSSIEYSAATRRGVRSARAHVVVHLLAAARVPAPQRALDTQAAVRQRTGVGFIVPKTIGNAVVRNTVRRRLRHIASDQLEVIDARIGQGSCLVFRALPGAGDISFTELRNEVEGAIRACLRRADS